MENKIPRIVVLSPHEKSIINFLAYLEKKFEYFERYTSELKETIYEEKIDRSPTHCFIIKDEAKVRISNKYYSVDVIITSCIVKAIQEKQEKVENEINKENNVKKKEGETKCECIIYLFDQFDKNEKTLINLNPFIKYEKDCSHFLENAIEKNILENVDFDFSSLYKEIGIKLILCPTSMKERYPDMVKFCSHYFIECLLIDFVPELSNDPKTSEKKEAKNNKFSDNLTEENPEERLIEALHCHMWTGLIKKNPKKTQTKQSTVLKDINEMNVKNKTERAITTTTPKKKHDTEYSHRSEEDAFMHNFTEIVEKIKIAKNENRNCSDDQRRQKAEELIDEIQKYFCDFDNEY